MRTYEELAKQYLSPPEYHRFKLNIGSRINMISYNEESFIDKAFLWKNQPEGQDYWYNIHGRCYEEITGEKE